MEAVRVLALIAKDDFIAAFLNRNGLKTGNGNRWTRERVTSLRSKNKIPGLPPRRTRPGALAQSSRCCGAHRRCRPDPANRGRAAED